MTKNANDLMTYQVINEHHKGWTATLVIGDIADWQANGKTLPEVEGFHFADFADVNAAYIQEIAPNAILSSLVSQRFDAFDIARLLGDMDYDGSYRVLALDIPNTELVVRDVKLIAPLLDFDVIDLAELFPDL